MATVVQLLPGGMVKFALKDLNCRLRESAAKENLKPRYSGVEVRTFSNRCVVADTSGNKSHIRLEVSVLIVNYEII